MYTNIVRVLAVLSLGISVVVGVNTSPEVNLTPKIPSVLSDTILIDNQKFSSNSATEVKMTQPISVTSTAVPQIIYPIREATTTPEAGQSGQPTEPTPVPTAIPDEIAKSQKIREQRIEILQEFLNKRNSPMVDNAQDFIDAAEQYDLDWRLVPAIAGVESTFGRNVLQGSYNPFGWGGGYIHFTSWRDAIYTVSKGISEKYMKDGLDTPNKMQHRYAPPSTTWASKVNYFMESIRNENDVVSN